MQNHWIGFPAVNAWMLSQVSNNPLRVFVPQQLAPNACLLSPDSSSYLIPFVFPSLIARHAISLKTVVTRGIRTEKTAFNEVLTSAAPSFIFHTHFVHNPGCVGNVGCSRRPGRQAPTSSSVLVRTRT